MEDFVENKIESGIYIRVGKENILLEDLDEAQRNEWLTTLEQEGLIRTVNHFCNIINSLNSYEN